MDLSPYHGAIVFIHVLGVLMFVLGHGISAGVLWRLRTERDPAAVRTLLDFSRRSMNFMTAGLATWFFAGIVAGFSGNGGAGWWTSGRYWIWAALGVALILAIAMTPLGRLYLNRVRAAVGIDPRTGAINADAAVDAMALEAAIASGRPMLVVGLGLGGLIVLTWLMVFKPF